jgi:hypothetical protein
MKKRIIYFGLGLGLMACGGEEGAVDDQNNDLDQSEINANEEKIPLLNMYGEDSIDAQGNIVYFNPNDAKYDEVEEPEDVNYELGPIPEDPYINAFGEDSLDADGNYVFPPRDTILLEE